MDFDPSSLGSYDLTSTGAADIFLAKYSPTGNLEWAFAIGGNSTSAGWEQGLSVAANTNGVYLGGVFGGTADFDPGAGRTTIVTADRDAFLAKYDPDGLFEWAISCGGSGQNDLAEKVVLDGRGGAAMDGQIARRVLEMFASMSVPQANYGLSDRETEILQHLVQGQSKKEIAGDLFLSPHTIDNHLRNLCAKLHVHNRSGAIAKALKERLV